ncbi:MAG: hypothetical protein SWJ54_03025 [Cyanobacteriota bacterium]|nr:hypothetical protein [Cyanobacteriota bacterium]
MFVLNSVAKNFALQKIQLINSNNFNYTLIIKLIFQVALIACTINLEPTLASVPQSEFLASKQPPNSEPEPPNVQDGGSRYREPQICAVTIRC